MASRSAWGGWIVFAGIVLLMVGAMDVLQGLVAIFEDEYVVATRKGLAIVDVTAWGWTTLLWGVLLIVAGLGLIGGAGWARWLAIIGVGVNAIQQVAFMANFPQAYPLWNILIVDAQRPRPVRAHGALAGLQGSRGLTMATMMPEQGVELGSDVAPASGVLVVAAGRLRADHRRDDLVARPDVDDRDAGVGRGGARRGRRTRCGVAGSATEFRASAARSWSCWAWSRSVR